MKIRFIEEGDVSQLAELLLVMRQETRYAAADIDLEHGMDNLRAMIARMTPSHCCFVAENAEGRVVGVLIGQLQRLIFNNFLSAQEGLFFVHPDARGSSAAVKLIYAFREWAKNRGAKEVMIAVRSGKDVERTNRFMGRLGFDHLGGNYSYWLGGE